jgi:hypothetical protein
MKKWFFLGRVTLKGAHISRWDEEPPAPVEADLADTPPSLQDEAAVAAGKTLEPVVFETLTELPLPSVGVQGF